MSIRREPKTISKPSHRCYGELFNLNGEELFIWSHSQVKWCRLWRSWEHEDIKKTLRGLDATN